MLLRFLLMSFVVLANTISLAQADSHVERQLVSNQSFTIESPESRTYHHPLTFLLLHVSYFIITITKDGV
jgi:hypothetical protein